MIITKNKFKKDICGGRKTVTFNFCMIDVTVFCYGVFDIDLLESEYKVKPADKEE